MLVEYLFRIMFKMDYWLVNVAQRSRTTFLRAQTAGATCKVALIDFLMKLFKTNNIDTVRNCQKEFAFELPSVILAYSEHFLIKYKACDNAFCKFV